MSNALYFLITSAKECEGKTTISKELVSLLRTAGYRVCFADGDYYKHGSESDIGFTDYLAGEVEPDDILKSDSISCGTRYIVKVDKERLSSLIDYLEDQFDFVFIDCAPYYLPLTQRLLCYFSNVIFITSNKHPASYNDYLYSKNIYEVDTIFPEYKVI